MCLGVPGRIVEIRDEPGGARTARADLPADSGEAGTRRLRVAYPPHLRIGDYTIAHAGLAHALIDEASAGVAIAAYGGFGDVR